MVLNYLFISFFLIGFLVALFRVLGYVFREFMEQTFGLIFTSADGAVFADMVNSTFSMAEASINIVLYLLGIMTLWLGFMKVGEDGGSIQKMSRFVGPFFTKLFPEVPAGHPAIGSMIMNFAANMLGLDNSATPMGLKAMKDLQTINPNPDQASNAQIMFLVLNTSGLTIIPISVIALRAANNATHPTEVFLPILMTTFIATIVGLISVAFIQKINLLQRALILPLLGMLGAFGLAIFGILHLSKPQLNGLTSIGGNFILLLVIVTFFWMAFRKKVNVYESFINGAKEGFQTSISIIPYLVGMLVAIGVFRASGTLDYVVNGIGYLVSAVGLNADFVPALPTALMKPLSGSGARGMMVEAMMNYGPDSFAASMASIFQGSTETTFYTIAVYYGVVNIKKTRYTVQAGLLADLAGILAAIFIGYLFFY